MTKDMNVTSMTNAPGLAEGLAHIELLDEHGRTVALRSAWSDRPALLVFIRHFG